MVPISSWAAVPVMAAMPTMLAVLRVLNQAAGDVDADGDGDELLQLAQTAKLAQHDLAEHQLAGGGAQGGGQGVEQHGQGQRDEQEVLNGEFHDPYLEFGDQFGEQGCQSVQGHGQHKDHQLLRLGGSIVF